MRDGQARRAGGRFERRRRAALGKPGISTSEWPQRRARVRFRCESYPLLAEPDAAHVRLRRAPPRRERVGIEKRLLRVERVGVVAGRGFVKASTALRGAVASFQAGAQGGSQPGGQQPPPPRRY